jgi:ABC-2 type transport system permease protein
VILGEQVGKRYGPVAALDGLDLAVPEGVGYLVSGFGASRSRAVGIAVLVLFAGYVGNFLFPLSDALTWAGRASPWFWAIGDQPVSNGVDAAWLAPLVLATAALVASGTAAAERRDIRSA